MYDRLLTWDLLSRSSICNRCWRLIVRDPHDCSRSTD